MECCGVTKLGTRVNELCDYWIPQTSLSYIYEKEWLSFQSCVNFLLSRYVVTSHHFVYRFEDKCKSTLSNERPNNLRKHEYSGCGLVCMSVSLTDGHSSHGLEVMSQVIHNEEVWSQIITKKFNEQQHLVLLQGWQLSGLEHVHKVERSVLWDF